jgi:hypothetical protein
VVIGEASLAFIFRKPCPPCTVFLHHSLGASMCFEQRFPACVQNDQHIAQRHRWGLKMDCSAYEKLLYPGKRASVIVGRLRAAPCWSWWSVGIKFLILPKEGVSLSEMDKEQCWPYHRNAIIVSKAALPASMYPRYDALEKSQVM